MEFLWFNLWAGGGIISSPDIEGWRIGLEDRCLEEGLEVGCFGGERGVRWDGDIFADYGDGYVGGVGIGVGAGRGDCETEGGQADW